MKIKVISEFIDKYTLEFHKVGEVLDCDESRLAEIESARKGLVTVVNTEPETAEPETAEPETAEPEKEQKTVGKKKGE